MRAVLLVAETRLSDGKDHRPVLFLSVPGIPEHVTRSDQLMLRIPVRRRRGNHEEVLWAGGKNQ